MAKMSEEEKVRKRLTVDVSKGRQRAHSSASYDQVNSGKSFSGSLKENSVSDIHSNAKDNDRPDSPCHDLADSLFSYSSGFTNYRGILNLCILLLGLTTGRVALENVMKYGILIDPLMWVHVFLQNPYHWPSFCLLLATNFFIFVGFAIETLLSKKAIPELFGTILHFLNTSASVVFPAFVVLKVHPSPITSSPVLAVYVCLFLKLISYQQVNKWCRTHYYSIPKAQRVQRHANTPRLRQLSVPGVNGLNKDVYTRKQCYPANLNLKDMYYFMLAPTLCYELNFPRTIRIRKRFLIKRVIEMVFLYGLMLSLIQQWIIPTVNNSLVPFNQLNFIRMVERVLKLAVPNHFIWLIFFYWLFHSSLNVIAELLCFGDRVFYRDWWNAGTVQYFWQTWNIPVHKWALRHLYKPMLGSGFSKMHANFVVFIVSAIFHEYLVSVPLRMFRLWAFMGLLGQIPLVMLTRMCNAKIGNMIVWMSLIIGQPAAILMYYHDYYVLNQSDAKLNLTMT